MTHKRATRGEEARRVRVATVLALILAASGAGAASGPRPLPRIWDVQPGTAVSELPEEELVDPACGTNGGPPGLRLESFEQFERCRPETSGLREIWFRYDDELEYIARAARDPDAVARNNAMVVLGQPLILSLLIDRAGLVQGYRIFTDPHADQDLRADAYMVAIAFKARFGTDGWECRDLPPNEGETPIMGTFVKQRCRPTDRRGKPPLLQIRAGFAGSEYRSADGEPIRELGAHPIGSGGGPGEVEPHPKLL